MNPRWHLSYASGYISLGLFREAEAELDCVPSPQCEAVEFLTVRAHLYQESKRWSELLPLAEQLCTVQPDDPGGWIMWAYATRRARNLEEAERILRSAEEIHSGDATIQFNLGCYACQRGDLTEAKLRVKRAIAIDAHFRSVAQEDPDLAPLRAQDPEII